MLVHAGLAAKVASGVELYSQIDVMIVSRVGWPMPPACLVLVMYGGVLAIGIIQPLPMSSKFFSMTSKSISTVYSPDSGK